MEAKELRIGNVINYIGKPVVCDLNTIYAVFKLVQFSKLYTPVPVTEAWLSSLGFVKSQDIDYRWFWLDKLVAYDIDDKYVMINDNCEFGKRHYVHQLQNLQFALTGTDIEIKL